MKRLSIIICTAAIMAMIIVSCKKDEPVQNEEPNHVEKTWAYEYEGIKLYYDRQLGDDFDSALAALIAERSELATLGENLFVEQSELNIKAEDDRQFYLLTFYEIKKDHEYFKQMLYAAYDVIDTKGVHYIVEWPED